MTTNKHAPLGSVSSGTMRPKDLIPEFLYTLGQLDKARHDALAEEYKDVLDGEWDEEQDCDGEGECAEQIDYCLEALFDALEKYAPPYCYFGAHEGDGDDYGFWVSWDAITEGEADGNIVRVNAGDEWPGEGDHVLEVTDHGNATLYDRAGNEIWAVV